MTSTPLGVGILGAGPVVQAIHLPTLARLGDRFRVVNIMDVNVDVATAVAARAGAVPSTSTEELLADPAVEVVAICSPGQFHAGQVIAAMRAGKKAVLCEKPLATSRAEAEEIAAVSAETGVPVIVGAMHAFDPGWLAAREHAEELLRTAHTIRSTMLIPSNERFEDWATEVTGRVPMTRPEGEPDAGALAAMINGAVLGLAIHDLPLIRAAIDGAESVRVVAAELLQPFGYSIAVLADDRLIHLDAGLHAQWQPVWKLEFAGEPGEANLEFTPSYVHAGSATAVVTRADGHREQYGPFEHNGYEGEWIVLHDLVHGRSDAAPSVASLIDDLTFAVDIADGAANLVRAAHTSQEGVAA